MNLLEDLQWRDLVADCTDLDGLGRRLAAGPITLYCGFDPTGDSLHVGHLMGQLMLRRFQLAGHHPIPLAGGATGMIGDPSGKSAERNLLTPRAARRTTSPASSGSSPRFSISTRRQNPARLVDNADWTAPVGFLDFLRDIGKHFSVNVMVAKDSVRSRMEGDGGISYTEFSYMLLQAYDFLHLRQTARLRAAGRRHATSRATSPPAPTSSARSSASPAWGLTSRSSPRPTARSSARARAAARCGSIRRRPAPTGSTSSSSTPRTAWWSEYLKKFTLLPREEIEPLAAEHARNPGARVRAEGAGPRGDRARPRAVRLRRCRPRQRDHVRRRARRASPRRCSRTSSARSRPRNSSSRSWRAPARRSSTSSCIAGLAPSKGQARKDIEAGGIYLNNVRVTEVARAATTADLLFGKFLLLRKGKRTYALLRCA